MPLHAADISRIVLVYAHLLLAALALGRIIVTDVSILLGDIRKEHIQHTARLIMYLLVGLWFSGLLIIYIDTGFDVGVLMAKPKIVLKLLCVMVMTINGVILHLWSFPLLMSGRVLANRHIALIAVSGALSSCHWLLAAFIGVTGELNWLDINILLFLYALASSISVITAITLLPLFKRRFNQQGMNPYKGTWNTQRPPGTLDPTGRQSLVACTSKANSFHLARRQAKQLKRSTNLRMQPSTHT